MIAYVNGEFLEEAQAKVSIFDRGFLYGDSVYETIRGHRGGPVFWEEHWQRLRRSGELAGFGISWERIDLKPAVLELLRRNRVDPSRLRITVSRGIGDYDQIDDFTPTWVVTTRPFTPIAEHAYEAGAAAVLVSVVRNAASSVNPEIKSGNLLNNLLARREARRRGAVEGIMRNAAGFVAEGATSNIFWVRRGALETPATTVGILHGVTRAKVLELARAAAGERAAGIEGLREVREIEATSERLDGAEEIFLTATTLEVLPITTWEGAAVGSGRRGPVARALRERLRALYPGGA